MRLLLTAAALSAAVPAGAATGMTVDQFLQTAAALEKRGMTALFSKDYKRLKGELRSAGLALRADQKLAMREGRRPTACLPPGEAQVTSNEVLAHFKAIPPAQRNMPAKTAFNGLMKRKYPCPG